MSWFTNIPIKRKLTIIILMTCVLTLLMAGVAMIFTELVTARRAMVQDMTALADVVGRYSTASLSFHRDEDVDEVNKILSAVSADPHIVAACLYDKDNKRFGSYVRQGETQEFPASPPSDGHRFTTGFLDVAYPVNVDQKRIGTMYMRADLERLYGQVEMHAGIMGLVLLCAIGITTALSPRLRKPITEPILALADLARRVAENKDYSARAVKQAQDEPGLLTDAFNQMLSEIETGQSSLQEANKSMQLEIAERAAAQERLKQQAQEVVESINVLVNSAGEILATSTQLSAGASETATAISQATTTVSEVRQAAQLSSKKASSVSESSQRMAQISQAGAKSTEDAAVGINRIRQQMDSIGDTMMRLGEQTQAIGQIVATVEDLAAQSNVLAVNASIEAAKAGEQGRGFAVVALEVRSLAEQSKQATNQVRNILLEIQKATGAAMMATEQGTKAVEAGVRQSSQAGESIQELSNSVLEAAQAATQIAASSQQQLVGVDQVVSAMDSIKQASAQNVVSAQQLEESAHSLKDLGQKLKQTVERYSV